MYRGREVAAGQWQAAALCRAALKFFFFKNGGGGPVCVTKRAPREVEGAKATAGLPQRVTRCCWTCFLESNYIRAPESHCKHE